MAVNYISVGQKIKEIRKRRGLTQAILAEEAGLSAAYISYIECGIKSLSVDALVLIANVLNATADEILRDSLENTVRVSNHEFTAILTDCSDYEKKVLYDVIVATKSSLRENKGCYTSFLKLKNSFM